MAAEEQQFEQFGGHPKGVYFLAFTEMWERFSFYGMSALLALYMVKELLPQYSAEVFGLAPLRHALEFNGALSDVAFASIIYGWYAGLVYFTPLIGGWVADRLLGAKRTVLIGVLRLARLTKHEGVVLEQLDLLHQGVKHRVICGLEGRVVPA